jgi:hypothetical protein
MTPDPHRTGADEAVAARWLGVGVTFSAACLAVGLGAWLLGIAPPFADAALVVGLVALMATPTLRVAVAVADALRARDWVFFASALAVLLVLVATVASALAQ